MLKTVFSFGAGDILWRVAANLNQGKGGASPLVLWECDSAGGTRDLGGVCR